MTQQIDIAELDTQHEIAQEKMSKLFQEKVIVGWVNTPSPTHFGEICRAHNRVDYRHYNDGDICFIGYGNETCGGEATFLKHEVSEKVTEHFKEFEAKKGFNDEKSYEVWLKQLTILLVEHMETTEDKPFYKDSTNVESEWEQDFCKCCGYLYPSNELDGGGICEECQEEDEEDDNEEE